MNEEERIKKYILEALEENFPVDDILKKLLKAGHNEKLVRSLLKKAIKNRIGELEKKKLSTLKDPMKKTFFAKRLTLEIFGAVLIRALVGMAMVFILADAVIKNVYFF